MSFSFFFSRTEFTRGIGDFQRTVFLLLLIFFSSSFPSATNLRLVCSFSSRRFRGSTSSSLSFAFGFGCVVVPRLLPLFTVVPLVDLVPRVLYGVEAPSSKEAASRTAFIFFSALLYFLPDRLERESWKVR